jgi:UDP-galactopyranose mutase
MKYRNIIIGAGITGLTLAERISSKGEKVLIVEKRDHIGGNCYDEFDDAGNYIQKYGPHIFHTKNKEVWDYLSNFTEWHEYEHEVLAKVKNQLIPIPFNFNSIDKLFSPSKSNSLKEKLKNLYGENQKIPILKLKKISDKDLKELADFIYTNIFLYYNLKQWDLRPEQMDSAVTARVPIFTGYNDKYFPNEHQGIPEGGFSKIFQKMINKKNIDLLLNVDYKKIIGKYNYEKLYYTGPLDYFFDYKFGEIQYRKISLNLEKHKTNSYQPNSVINYPTKEEKFTRITEFNKFLKIKNDSTIIAKEYPSWEKGFSAYPVQTEKNFKVINKYLKEAKKQKNTFFIGRLAECKYYNMDEVIKKAINLIN